MTDQPISEQFRIVAKEWVDANAAADMLEECKSATLAQMMAAHGDVAVNRAEQIVKSSKDWTDYINGMVEARKKANFLKVKLEYIRMKFQEWNSKEASKRAEMKL